MPGGFCFDNCCPSAGVSCTACGVPTTLQVTDINQSGLVCIKEILGDGSVHYYGCYTVNMLANSEPACGCEGQTVGPVAIAYDILLTCPSDVMTFTVTRFWPIFPCKTGAFTWGPYELVQASCGFSVSTPIAFDCVVDVGPDGQPVPRMSKSSLSQAVGGSCGAITWSGTLVNAPDNFVSDPIGGTVAVAS